MDHSERVLLSLLLITAGQGLVLAGIVARPSFRFHSIRMLALFFLLISLGCAERSIEGLFYPVRGEELPFPMALPLAYSPALYLHLRLLFGPEKRLRARDAWHFAPALTLDLLSFYLLPWDGNKSGWELTSNRRVTAEFLLLYDGIFIAHFVAYTAALIRLRDRARQQEESFDASAVRWIERLIPVFTVFWASWVLVKLIGKGNLVGLSLSYFVHAAAMVTVYWFGFAFILKLRQPFAKQLSRKAIPRESKASAILRRIQESHLYKSHKITLSEAAKRLGCSQKEVSSAVNGQRHANFNEYINHLRVEAFKERARESGSENLSLFGIAQEVGFSSKASFHRAFKKECGLTPGEYLSLNAG